MDGLAEVEQQRWQRMQNFNDGYLQCNAKRPQAVGYARSSPDLGPCACCSRARRSALEQRVVR